MPRSVLVVEKDKFARLTIAYMVNVMGYRVVEANSHESALGALSGVWFNTTIVSPTQDDPDGRRFAWEAKTLQPHIKVILVSGGGEQHDLAPYVDAFVAKPFTLEQIKAAIVAVQGGDGDDYAYQTPHSHE